VYKGDIIRFLFALSFPVYGVGSYLSAISPSKGFLVSASVPLMIILFYSIDVTYRRVVRTKVNVIYVLMTLFLCSSIVSLFAALNKNLPETTLSLTITRSILLIAPFNAFVIVTLYLNSEKELLKWTLISLSLLVLINLVGHFGFGLINLTHSIEGQLSFPFLDAFYSGANLLMIINLILLYYLRKTWSNPVWFSLLLGYFALNLILFHLINSRLATLIFLVVFIMILFNAIKFTGVYWISMLTLPILLSSGLLLYEILKTPALASVMQRVDIEDVTTFHGRSYLWNDALDWLINDQRGLWLGNGYKGHFFLDLIPDVVKLWNAEDSYHLHLHSTSLEILVCQGLIFYGIYCFVFYRAFTYYKQKHNESSEGGAFLPVVVFLLFMMQVDTFLYLDGLGSVILALLVSNTAIRDTSKKAARDRLMSEARAHSNSAHEKFPMYDLHRSARS
jgi:hypothetical protein